jgi:hypothetical protein
MKFPVKFPVSREFGCGDRFACDCVRHHQIKGLVRSLQVGAPLGKQRVSSAHQFAGGMWRSRASDFEFLSSLHPHTPPEGAGVDGDLKIDARACSSASRRLPSFRRPLIQEAALMRRFTKCEVRAQPLGTIWTARQAAKVESGSNSSQYVRHAARSTRVSISLRNIPKSIGLVKSASAPLSNALRLVSASP